MDIHFASPGVSKLPPAHAWANRMEKVFALLPKRIWVKTRFSRAKHQTSVRRCANRGKEVAEKEKLSAGGRARKFTASSTIIDRIWVCLDIMCDLIILTQWHLNKLTSPMQPKMNTPCGPSDEMRGNCDESPLRKFADRKSRHNFEVLGNSLRGWFLMLFLFHLFSGRSLPTQARANMCVFLQAIAGKSMQHSPKHSEDFVIWGVETTVA